MAHANIDERRAHVGRLLADGREIDISMRDALARVYGCSSAAIVDDVKALTGVKSEKRTVAIPQQLIKELDALCAERGWSRSQVVAEAIRRLLKKPPARLG